MISNYQQRASNQIYKVQTDRKLIALYDRLKYAFLTNYAQIHAKGEYIENDHKAHSLIGITIQDYSNGTGENNMIVQFNLIIFSFEFLFSLHHFQIV